MQWAAVLSLLLLIIGTDATYSIHIPSRDWSTRVSCVVPSKGPATHPLTLPFQAVFLIRHPPCSSKLISSTISWAIVAAEMHLLGASTELVHTWVTATSLSMSNNPLTYSDLSRLWGHQSRSHVLFRFPYRDRILCLPHGRHLFLHPTHVCWVSEVLWAMPDWV